MYFHKCFILIMYVSISPFLRQCRRPLPLPIRKVKRCSECNTFMTDLDSRPTHIMFYNAYPVTAE